MFESGISPLCLQISFASTRCLGCLYGSLLIVQDEKRQLQREFDSEVERLQVELAHVTLERDQAVQ